MKSFLVDLLRLFHYTWMTHWIESGKDKIGIHGTLDELYEDLKDYIDEVAETGLSSSLNSKDVSELNLEVKLGDDPLESLVSRMREVRESLNRGRLNAYPELEDLKGRLVSSLNHYIFMLGTRESSFKLFSNKKDPLVENLRKLFKNQSEFVTVFNSYLKGKCENEEIKSFFKSHENELIDLSNTILTTNTELFSIRESVPSDNPELVKNYNELVKFFDLFID